MSDYYDNDYDQPDGFCVDCGSPTEAEHHRWCMACYSAQWDDDEPDDDECDACGRTLIQLASGALLCPNPHCTGRAAA